MTSRRGLQFACSAIAFASFATICASSAAPARQIAGLSLISAFTCSLWFMHRNRTVAIVPAAGLTLCFLILAGLGLAAADALSTVPVALTLTGATLIAVWAGAGASLLGFELAEEEVRLKPPNPLVLGGVLVFALAASLAVRYAASSAKADADGATSVAIWAYPAGDQLHVGVQQPAGHGAASLRIVVTQVGATVATWNDIRLSPGQTWEAPALTLTGTGPAQVVALHGGTVVASLSSR